MRKIAASFAMAGLVGLMLLPAGALAQATNYLVFFAPWSAAIDSNGKAAIAIAAKNALSHPNDPVIVVGSADTVGGAAANTDMAGTRAQVVADALVADGVPRGRIAIVSTGGLKAPGAAAGSYAQFSRRVLIQVGS